MPPESLQKAISNTFSTPGQKIAPGSLQKAILNTFSTPDRKIPPEAFWKAILDGFSAEAPGSPKKSLFKNIFRNQVAVPQNSATMSRNRVTTFFRPKRKNRSKRLQKFETEFFFVGTWFCGTRGRFCKIVAWFYGIVNDFFFVGTRVCGTEGRFCKIVACPGLWHRG